METNYSFFEIINVIDSKLIRLGKAININIFQNLIAFGISIIFFFNENSLNILPPIEGIQPEEYIAIFPLLLVCVFVHFGFITLRYLKLIVERDKTIMELTREPNNGLRNLVRLKNIYRQSSLGEIFYKTLVFGGIEVEGFVEEPTKIYKPFTFFSIILVVIVNTLLTLIYFFSNHCKDNLLLAFFLFLGICVIIFCYFDYYKKVKVLKRDIKMFYLTWKSQVDIVV